MERTCILLKPDALKRRLAGRIISRIEEKGYIISEVRTLQLNEAVLREHYPHLVDEPFFPDIVAYNGLRSCARHDCGGGKCGFRNAQNYRRHPF